MSDRDASTTWAKLGHHEDGMATRAARLLAAAAIMAIVWLKLLPWIGACPPVRERLDRLADHHIDAGAMFYTELDVRLFPLKHADQEDATE